VIETFELPNGSNQGGRASTRRSTFELDLVRTGELLGPPRSSAVGWHPFPFPCRRAFFLFRPLIIPRCMGNGLEP